MSKIYSGKIEVVSFVIKYGREFTIGGKFNVMSRNEAVEAVSVVSVISSCLVCINGLQLAKLELLIDRTSSIYMKVRQKLLYFLFL